MSPVHCRLMAALFAVFIVSTPFLAGAAGQDGVDWWNVPYPEPFDASGLTTSLQRLHVEGNRFVDEDGNTVVLLRGQHLRPRQARQAGPLEQGALPGDQGLGRRL